MCRFYRIETKWYGSRSRSFLVHEPPTLRDLYGNKYTDRSFHLIKFQTQVDPNSWFLGCVPERYTEIEGVSYRRRHISLKIVTPNPEVIVRKVVDSPL